MKAGQNVIISFISINTDARMEYCGMQNIIYLCLLLKINGAAI